MSLFGRLLGRDTFGRARVVVKGRVTDGGFHLYAGKVAQHRDLSGWLRVKDAFSSAPYLEIEVEGERPQLKNYILDLRKGTPDNPHITHVSIQWLEGDKRTHSGFKIFS